MRPRRKTNETRFPAADAELERVPVMLFCAFLCPFQPPFLTFHFRSHPIKNPIKPVAQQPDTSATARQLSITDMLRGAALMLLALGYVLLCFHTRARFVNSGYLFVLALTRALAAVGFLGLMVAEGMNVFLLKKHRFPVGHYATVPATFGVFLTGGVLVFPEILFSPGLPAVVSVVGGFAFLSGWLAGFALQGRLLLAPDAYMAYMRRKHDFRKVMLIFGRFPVVFFLAMLFCTQLLAWVTAFSAGYRWHDFDLSNGRGGLPHGFGYNLARVWLTWFCILGVLYPLCKWLGRAAR